jgi:1-acyl-sn-glycerol-3-phosphate acyltransferase
MTSPAARALYATLHHLALPTLSALFRLRCHGRANLPRSGGALVAANHQSYLDPVCFGGALPRPIDYFARRSLFKGPLGALIRALNALPVERGGRDLGAIRVAIERLRAGRVLLLFPEGTRTATGEVGAFEPGVAAIARRAGVPVVPAAVAGAFEAWPRGARLFRAGTPCAVALGRPIPPDAPDLLERLRADVVALKAGLDRKLACVAPRRAHRATAGRRARADPTSGETGIRSGYA